MTEEEKEKIREKYRKKAEQKKEDRKKIVILSSLMGLTVLCVVLAIVSFGYARDLGQGKQTESDSFYVYYADCPVCKKDLPKLNKDGKYPSYEFTNDKAKIVNKIGFDKYEQITKHRVPVKITVDGDEVKYKDNPLK